MMCKLKGGMDKKKGGHYKVEMKGWMEKEEDRIYLRIYLLARRNLLWDILRLPSSRRAALGLYVILTL